MGESSSFAYHLQRGRQPAVLIWDTTSGECLGDLRGHPYGVAALAVSPNGRFVVSVGSKDDENLFIWDWKNSVCVASSNIGKTKVNIFVIFR